MFMNKNQIDSQLAQPTNTFLATYIWIDSTGQLIRSKMRTFDFEPLTLSDYPWWDSTEPFLDSYINTDVVLEPVKLFNDPFFTSGGKNRLVLCEAYYHNKTPKSS